MTPERWDALLAHHLDGEDELDSSWDGIDEAQSAELLDLVELDCLLRHRFRREDPQAFGRGVWRRIDAERTGPSFARRVDRRLGHPRRSLRRLLAAAAALVIGVGVYLLWPAPEPIPPIARLEDVKGRVEILGEEGRSAACTGSPLHSGQGVETVAADGRATLVYADGTRVKIDPRTALRRVSDNGTGKRLMVANGSIAAVVKPQRAGRPMTFATPHGEATVLGTSLRIVVEANGKKLTRLEVEEGKVRLKSLLDTQTVDVQSGHYAVAAAGVKLVAKPLSARTAEAIRGMAPGSWLSIPDTRMRAVAPTSGQFPGTWGIVGPASVVQVWSGAALDSKRNRLMLWGGRGAGDYRGNEVYAFDLSSLQWERLTDPFINPAEESESNPDGTPTSQSTYNCLAYMAHADRLFARTPTLTWTFDPAGRRWARRNPSPDAPPLGYSSNCSYDPASRKVWWCGTRGFWSYDPDRDAWARHGDEEFNDHTSVIDPKRGLLVVAGNGEMFTYDLRSGDLTRRSRTTTGGAALIGKRAPGLDYDPVRDRIMGWHGGAVYALHLETNVWTAQEAPGAPATTPNGIYGRWRYVPTLDVFVVVTDIDENVHVYRPER